MIFNKKKPHAAGEMTVWGWMIGMKQDSGFSFYLP